MSNLLAWREIGEGPPLLLVHGLGGSARTWSGVARALRDRFRVLSVDLPGHGEAPAADRPFSLESLAEAVAVGIQERSALAPTVVGHSVGGFIGLRLALAGPVARLVMIGSEAGRSAMSWLSALPRYTDVVSASGMGSLFDVLSTEDPAMSDLLGRHPELVTAFRAAFAQVSPRGFIELARAALERLDLSDQLVRLQIPTVSIVGSLDRDFAAGARAFAMRTGGTFVSLDGLGHMPMLEDADSVAREISNRSPTEVA